VPFYVRTGKHLAQRLTEIAIRFKQGALCRLRGHAGEYAAAQLAGAAHRPREGISLQFEVKRRGPVMDLGRRQDGFPAYDDWFAREQNVGYETLLYASWSATRPVHARRPGRAGLAHRAARARRLGGRQADFPNYDSGSTGPAACRCAVNGDRAWRPVALPPKPKA